MPLVPPAGPWSLMPQVPQMSQMLQAPQMPQMLQVPGLAGHRIVVIPDGQMPAAVFRSTLPSQPRISELNDDHQVQQQQQHRQQRDANPQTDDIQRQSTSTSSARNWLDEV